MHAVNGRNANDSVCAWHIYGLSRHGIRIEIQWQEREFGLHDKFKALVNGLSVFGEYLGRNNVRPQIVLI